VSAQSIYNWETGISRPREAMMPTLQQLRALSKRDALQRLAEIGD